MLFDLLEIQKELSDRDISAVSLNKIITRQKTEMDKEDVAYVKEMIEEL